MLADFGTNNLPLFYFDSIFQEKMMSLSEHIFSICSDFVFHSESDNYSRIIPPTLEKSPNQ